MTKQPPAITRSRGIPAPGWAGPVPGGGFSGATSALDLAVQAAAEHLADMTGRPVEIRFNADRMSGGAYLAGEPRTLGIKAGLYPEEEPDPALPWRERSRLWDVAPKVLGFGVFADTRWLRDPALADMGPPGSRYALPEVANPKAGGDWIREHCLPELCAKAPLAVACTPGKVTRGCRCSQCDQERQARMTHNQRLRFGRALSRGLAATKP